MLPLNAGGASELESDQDGEVAAVMDGMTNTGGGDEGEGGAVGKHQVDAGGTEFSLAVVELIGPGERGGEELNVNVSPRCAGTEEGSEQGASWAAAAGAGMKIPSGANGAVEVAEQQSRDLHVQSVGELQEGRVEASTCHKLSGEGCVDGNKEQAQWEPRTWGKGDNM